jgi:hypothetical protein
MSDSSAFRVNERYDADYASDRRSRYGAYLSQNRRRFHHDGPDRPPTTCPVRFAIEAWTVAAPPIMAPGYVTNHARIQDTGFHWDDSRAALEVRIAVPAPASASHLTSRWSGWLREPCSMTWRDPYSNDSVTVLSTLTIRIPLVASRLPTPRYTRELPDTDVAKHAVVAMCRIANGELDNLLFAVDAPSGPAL